MSENTRIEWADDTVNIAGGCTEQRLINGKMDPACVNCYARLMSVRSEAMAAEAGRRTVYDNVAERTQGHGARWTGVLRWDRELMRQRFAAMRGGRRVFLGSMTDLWHEGHNPALLIALAEEIRAIGERPPHKRPSIITLTKREQRLLAWQREHFPDGLPPWVWPGVTAGCQEAADQRVPVLLQVRAEGPRVISVEPMTGPVDLSLWMPRFDYCPEERAFESMPGSQRALGDETGCQGCPGNGRGECAAVMTAGVGWVIVGGESGQKARPMHPDWARKLRDQCVAAGVPFLFKHWGEWAPRPIEGHPRGIQLAPSGEVIGAGDGRGCGNYNDTTASVWLARIGKRAAGRELDGRTWDQVPGEVP